MLDGVSANEFDWAERIGRLESLTAAWRPLSSEFLSAKAKAQARDAKGRWIEMGAMVKFWGVNGRKDQDAKMRYGKVVGYQPDEQAFQVYESGKEMHRYLVPANKMEVVKAVIPDADDSVDPQGLDLSPSAATPHYPSSIRAGDVLKTAQGPYDVLEILEDDARPGDYRIRARSRRSGKEGVLTTRRSFQVYDHPELLTEQS